jgi:hypothetical protein
MSVHYFPQSRESGIDAVLPYLRIRRGRQSDFCQLSIDLTCLRRWRRIRPREAGTPPTKGGFGGGGARRGPPQKKTTCRVLKKKNQKPKARTHIKNTNRKINKTLKKTKKNPQKKKTK